MKKNTNQKIETGIRMTFELSLPSKVQNIYSQKEVEDEKQKNVLICLKKYVGEFEKQTNRIPTSISLSSDLLYLIRQQIQVETGEYVSSDKAIWNGIKLKSGCNVGETEIIISTWHEKQDDIIIA